jgi:hypothetical protein
MTNQEPDQHLSSHEQPRPTPRSTAIPSKNQESSLPERISALEKENEELRS